MGDEVKTNGSAPSLFAGAIAALEKVKEREGTATSSSQSTSWLLAGKSLPRFGE